MKKALIDPTASAIQYISGWTDTIPYQALYPNYANSCRVAEVCDREFQVAHPLFWVACNDAVVQDKFYYDTARNEILPVVNAPAPKVQTN